MVVGGLASVAVALAATLAFDRTVVRLVLSGLSLALLALPVVLPRLPTLRRRLSPRLSGFLSPQGQTKILAALALAALSHAAALELAQLTTTPWVRVWNVYHYYLGAEYFEELGFYDLYQATLAADRQGADYWKGIDQVRNLRTYAVEPRSIGERRFDPRETFSDPRWQSFREDVAALQTQLPPRSWRNVFTDRGYNPSPFWTFVGQRFTSVLPATSLAALKILASLDLLLLLATFWFLRRTFGLRPALLVLLFLCLSPVNIGRLVGGFLQYDWFCAIAAGLCWLRKGKPVASAGAFAYATLARVFPAILVASALIPMVVRWIQEGKIRKPQLRFLLALGVFGLVGLGLGSLTGRGPQAWVEFVSNLGHHSEEHTYGQRRVGLKHVFTHDLRSWAFDEGVTERRELFARQLPLYQGAAALCLGAFLLAVYRRRGQDAFLLGLVPFFVLAASSRYYWACLALLPLLARPGPGGERRWNRLAFAQAALYGGYYLFNLFRPDRYASYSVFNLLLLLFLGFLMGGFLAREIRARHRLRRRSQERPARAWYQRGEVSIGFFALLFVVLCLLRMPLPDHPIRDVDESVSAIIATNWLEGGVPYRDAIDQRGPVTYLLYALTFLVAGANNLYAVHWALLLLILISSVVVFQLARRLRPGPAGWGMAFVATALFAIATYTYRRSQMLAFHTEWPGMLASAVGMLLLWKAIENHRKRELWLSGACFGLAFLSKQPAVFDGAAAGIFLLLLAWVRGGFASAVATLDTLKRATALAGGFFAVVLFCVAYFAAQGALGDFYLYYWQYNVEHYAAVVPFQDQLAGLNPFGHRRHYLTANPLLFAGAVLSVLAALGAMVRKRTWDGQSLLARSLLTLWLLFSYFGASYSGRNFGHYFIQIIPPLCLLTAWLIVDLWRGARRIHPSRMGAGIFRVAVVWVVVLLLGSSLHRFRGDIALANVWKPARTDAAREGLLREIRATTEEDDTLFVWGYNPEIYVLAPRRPATRYSNTNYLTGMLPWENHQRGVDTSEHIVDGGWDILFAELEASRPRLIVDTSPGDHRYYSKYPIAKFPRLQSYLADHYAPAATIEDRKGRPYYQVYRRVP